MITTGHKITLSVFFILLSLSAYAQSKNEQIQILTGKIDSLTTVSKQENLKFTALEKELKTTNNDLKATINALKLAFDELKASIQNKNETIKNLTLELATQKKSAGIQIDYLQAKYPYLQNLPKSDFNFITVNYANLVNGFKVKAAWSPILVNRNEFNADVSHVWYAVSGPAIIQFSNTKDSVLFTVDHPDFTLNKDLFSITYVNTDSVDIASLNTSNITIQNKAQAQMGPSKHLDFEETFGFADVNFDGVKELILRNLNMGMRETSTYTIYNINNYDDVYLVRDNFFSDRITDETEFNYATKTISIAEYGVDDALRNIIDFQTFRRDLDSYPYEFIPIKSIKLMRK